MFEKVTSIIGMLAILFMILGLIFPTAAALDYSRTVYEQWNTIAEFESSASLREFLLKKNWVSENVDMVDFDYILVLTQQLASENFDYVTPELALAVISVESGFRPSLESPKGAQGLMQVVPKWHQDRIEKYRYDENVDLFDPRLNIMVGMDYLDYILSETEGDLPYALMWYNGGARYAVSNYVTNGLISSYAELVMRRAGAIHDILERR